MIALLRARCALTHQLTFDWSTHVNPLFLVFNVHFADVRTRFVHFDLFLLLESF